MHQKYPIIRSLVCLFPCLSAITAHAATAESDSVSRLASGVRLSEVAVTAIKGGNTPNADEAVTSLGRRTVEDYDLLNLHQASELAPNFYIPSYGSRMTSSIYVRGLGTRIDQPAVGLNIDNIPIINKDNYDFDLTDIARVELLRGPQNILYGRNTMGGLINIYTLSPLNFEGARARVSYGSRNSYRVSAGVYGRLTPRLGMSLTGDINGTDGFFRNSYNNSRTGRERLGSLRWKTTLRPTGKVVVENTAIITRARQNGYPYAHATDNVIAYNDTCSYSRFSFVDGLTVKHSFRSVTFSAIMSAQYLDDDMRLDQDFTAEPYFTLRQKRKEWAFTADLVARGPQSGLYSWLGGFFGFYRRSRMSAPVDFYQTGIQRLIVDNRNRVNPDYPIAWDSDHFTLGSDFRTPSGGLSAYHESTLRLGDFTLTAGLRFDWERTNLHYHSVCSTSFSTFDNTGTSPAAGASLPLYRRDNIDIDDSGFISHDYTQLLPKFSVSYQLGSESGSGVSGNIYASVTKGYKSGGYNTQMFSDFLQQKLMASMGMSEQYDVDATVAYRPETDWNYEVGTHLSLLDNALHLDAALFWIEVRDQQVTMLPEGSITGRIMTNAGRSRSRGIELSASWYHPSGWFARGAWGYTDARFVRFDSGRADYSGCRVPYAPSHTLFAGAGFRHALKGVVDGIELEVNTRGVGNIAWDEANTTWQPFYALLNASATASHGPWRLRLWADNITSTQYASFYFVSIGNAFLQRGNGFSAGATISCNFEF